MTVIEAASRLPDIQMGRLCLTQKADSYSASIGFTYRSWTSATDDVSVRHCNLRSAGSSARIESRQTNPCRRF